MLIKLLRFTCIVFPRPFLGEIPRFNDGPLVIDYSEVVVNCIGLLLQFISGCFGIYYIMACTFEMSLMMFIFLDFFELQEVTNNEISKRERERLKEMQKLKKHKIQEILDQQNAAIDADMVCLFYKTTQCISVACSIWKKILDKFT